MFGFASEDERYMFRTLIKVNGVGAKMALTILSGIESSEFAACIQQGDSERLVKLPGVGKKTAERLIIEMRDRLKDWQSPWLLLQLVMNLHYFVYVQLWLLAVLQSISEMTGQM